MLRPTQGLKHTCCLHMFCHIFFFLFNIQFVRSILRFANCQCSFAHRWTQRTWTFIGSYSVRLWAFFSFHSWQNGHLNCFFFLASSRIYMMPLLWFQWCFGSSIFTCLFILLMNQSRNTMGYTCKFNMYEYVCNGMGWDGIPSDFEFKMSSSTKKKTNKQSSDTN